MVVILKIVPSAWKKVESLKIPDMYYRNKPALRLLIVEKMKPCINLFHLNNPHVLENFYILVSEFPHYFKGRTYMTSISSEDFCKSVRENEDKFGIIDCIYVQCVEEFSKCDLNLIDERVRDRILLAFLFGWGSMQRQLGHAGLQAVFEKLKDPSFAEKIEQFRKKKIEDAADLMLQRDEIVDLFDGIARLRFISNKEKSKKAGSTTASKVLHLFCPDFFIMWDVGIRAFFLKRTGNGVDYFDFLCKMKLKLKELSPAMKELEKEQQD
jgi:hypothetical protein